jgi:hypothetical protein
VSDCYDRANATLANIEQRITDELAAVRNARFHIARNSIDRRLMKLQSKVLDEQNSK